MTEIYYKSDIKIFIDLSQTGGVPEVPFEFRYYTNSQHKYISCGWDGCNYINCKEYNGGLLATWECPNFYPGELKVLKHFYQKDERLDDKVFNFITAERTDILITDEPIPADELAQDIVYKMQGEQGEKGDKGDKGDNGADGTNGADAPYPSWITDTKPTYTATEVGALPNVGGILKGAITIPWSSKYHAKQIVFNSNSKGFTAVGTDTTGSISVKMSLCNYDPNGKMLNGLVSIGYVYSEYYSMNSFQYFTLDKNGEGSYCNIYHSGNLPSQQSMALAAPMSAQMSFSSAPQSIEAVRQSAAYEEGEVMQFADYWLYRYDITPSDEHFEANEVMVYGELTENSITRAVMEAEFGKGYETKLINDYMAVELGVIEDSGQRDKYIAFLERRETIKAQISIDFSAYDIAED